MKFIIKLAYLILLITTVLVKPYRSFAQAGSLDVTFGNSGIVTTLIGTTDRCNSIALQNDNKILVAGASKIGANYDFALLRYKSNGNLDSSFGNIGKITVSLGTGDDIGKSVAIQTDGKILLAGYSAIGTSNYFALIRVNSNGILDTTFNNDGKVITSIGSNDDNGNAMALQANGKILVAGYSFNGSSKDLAIVRYNTDGSLDSSFDYDGKVTTSFSAFDEIGNSIAVQPDGKIIVAGNAEFNTSYPKIALARYNSDGSLDSSFDNDGKVTASIGLYANGAQSVFVQTDGKIVTTGYTNFGFGPVFALLRYNPTGSLDSTFDFDGIVMGTSTHSIAYSTLEQSDHKIIVAGWTDTTSLSNAHHFTTYRYKANGTIDSSFGINGRVITAIADQNDCSSAAIQMNGKILVAGTSYSNSLSASIGKFSLARYNNDTSLCPPIYFTHSITLCYGQSVTVGNNTYNASGTYTDILASVSSGCDSVVTTHLTVLPAINSIQSITLCYGQSVTVGINTYNSTGTYTDTFTSVTSGCDSVVTTHLTVLPAINNIQSITLCSGQSVTVGNNTYNASGIYIDTLIAVNSCDSIITTNLMVNSIPLSSTSVNGIMITSNQTNADYQWIDCNNNNLPIIGATNQSYIPITNGNYAVVVTLGLCADTSSCVNIVEVGVDPYISNVGTISIYPNPFSSSAIVQSDKLLKNSSLKVYNLYGQLVEYLKDINGYTFRLYRNNLPSGIYLTALLQDDKIVSRNSFIIEDE